MSDQQPERYKELDIGVLRNLITSFLNPYPFVRAVYLYPGKESPYALVFDVPDEAEGHQAYLDFCAALDTLPTRSVDLKKVYRARIAGVDDRSDNEWQFYRITDIRNIEFNPLADFILFLSYDRLQIYGQGVTDNSRHLFPELHFNTLQTHVIEWARKWQIIQSVRLFRYSPLYNPSPPRKRLKYALLFDISGDEAEILRFKSEIDCNQVPDDYNYNVYYKNLMPPAFENVYRQRPSQDYQLEWIVVTTERVPAHRYFDTNVSWLLYDRYTEISTDLIRPAETQGQEINKPQKQSPSTREMSEFERGLIQFVKVKRKKSPSISIPNIALLVLRAEDDFLYTLKKTREKPKKETIEKYIRKLDKEQD